jgi:hypothetical protein
VEKLDQQLESDVLTRRMQFRLKKDKKAARERKKEEKKVKKAEDAKAKEEKKRLREEKKKQKEEAKTGKGKVEKMTRIPRKARMQRKAKV